MTCRKLTELLGELVSGELAAEQRDGIDGHLGGCPSCVALVESYRLTVRVARMLPPAPPPPGMVERLEAALRAHPPC